MLHHRLRGVQRSLALSYIQSLSFTPSIYGAFSATPQAGDLLIYLAGGTTSGLFVADPTIAIPTDFTQLCTHAEGNGSNSWGGRTTIAYKIADGTETGADGGITVAGVAHWRMLQFRATRPVAGVNVIDTDGAWATGDPASKTLDAPGALPALAVGVFYYRNTGSPTVTFTVSGETEEALDETYHRSRFILYDANSNTLTADTTDLGDIQGFSAAVLTVE
jgi:hypothetical protein